MLQCLLAACNVNKLVFDFIGSKKLNYFFLVLLDLQYPRFLVNWATACTPTSLHVVSTTYIHVSANTRDINLYFLMVLWVNVKLVVMLSRLTFPLSGTTCFSQDGKWLWGGPRDSFGRHLRFSPSGSLRAL